MSQELLRLKPVREWVRVRDARDLLMQGSGGLRVGELPVQRVPMNPCAEPFVCDVILSAAHRASQHLFPKPRTEDNPQCVYWSKSSVLTGGGVNNIAMSQSFKNKMHEPEDVHKMHEAEDVHKMHEEEDVMHEPEDVQFDDSRTGFNILLQIVTAKSC